MKIAITIFFLVVGVIGLATDNGNAALFGLVGLGIMYGICVIRESYLKSEKPAAGLLPITLLSFFGATHLAAQASEPPLKFERRYSYYESRDRHDPVTYSFTKDCYFVSNGEIIKTVIGEEAEVVDILSWGTDADGNPYIDTEEHRFIIRPNEIVRIWAATMRNYDIFKFPKA